jgi:hypothetical protein
MATGKGNSIGRARNHIGFDPLRIKVTKKA